MWNSIHNVIQAQKCGGIIGLWKKNILDNFDNQNQGKNKAEHAVQSYAAGKG